MITYPNFKFDILTKDKASRARTGCIVTPHGVVETPNFIFCGTKATVKGVDVRDLKALGTQIILSNTYHLMLQPTADVVEKMGGLHKFMGWDGPLLTDSGGFQVFSLGHGSVASEIKRTQDQYRNKSMLKITEEGALFRSYLSGEKILLTPEKSMDVQRKLRPDIALVFDECTPFNVSKSYTAMSMERSHRWAVRSRKAFEQTHDGTQALYGIVQGGVYEDLRQMSAQFVNAQPFFGHAVGGSLGATKEQMYHVVDLATQQFTPQRPVHLLGIGGIRDIWEGVQYGIDTFDCVHPTRLARHGGALVQGYVKEHINLNNGRYKQDSNPIDKDCACSTCQRFSRGYLHHLLKAKELMGMTLLTHHNIYFMNQLVAAVRKAINENRLAQARTEWLAVTKE
jgi:queuine tRNA-ribosyltransferase